MFVFIFYIVVREYGMYYTNIGNFVLVETNFYKKF